MAELNSPIIIHRKRTPSEMFQAVVDYKISTSNGEKALVEAISPCVFEEGEREEVPQVKRAKL
ncbi:uncharacterized protein FOMMEDRAFT_16584 [Fomitiporia mediterranea MF3/22]|uniref:uncharacterized protein n=1 Tax=Fomitiporia mediterranea (strain MF3/22) TaxID=694068 RepID=UPI0004408D80|nr:uncharacterized protein FOMMEDRAFT_16584 [Fomitiporia mediterranea MF3/22]EJD08093.1 hypothetical protein FOMMEDRAFT_16584 [Fomitiporia mediterranea MF3/22]